MPSIAVVDDEANIRETVEFALRREGYDVQSYADGLDAWAAFESTLPDVAILDILMPRMDGLELCRKLRAASETIPIIFLTSRDDEIDRVLGLELGADDYLGKPFSMRELVARVRVMLRRASKRAETPRSDDKMLRVGSLELDPARFIVRWKGQQIDLTVTEFLMLQALVRHPGHVKRIRKKFESIDAQFDRIDTVYGMGYRYQPETAGAK